MLSERSSQYPGPYRLSRAPYTREPLEQFGRPEIEEITNCWAAQTGKTQNLYAMMGFALDVDPGPLLLVMPNETLARSVSESRIQPLIEDCAALRRHKPIDPDRFKILEMHFDRCTWNLVGANSPANLATRPVRYLFLDEPDKYPLASAREAAAVDLAMERTKTFWNRKVVRSSTPTLTGGDIWRAFLRGDRRYYHVPCPHCGQSQRLHFGQIRWPEELRDDDGTWQLHLVAERARYECEKCSGPIRDYDKPAMLVQGQWIPERPGGRHYSTQLSGLYPIWSKWGQVAAKFLASRPFPDSFRNFVNSWLGEPWEERGQAAGEDEILRHRGSQAPGECPVIPAEVILTADVQQDCCYYRIRAWDFDESSYGLRYGVVPRMADLLVVAQSEFRGPKGPFAVTSCWIDTAYNTEEVYKFCRANGWQALKGVDGRQQSQRYRWTEVAGLRLCLVLSSYFKDLLQLRLKVALGDPGAWHLERDADQAFARHLTAETLIEETDRWGRPVRRWKRLRPLNHWLDCEVYQIAAATTLGIRDYPRGPAASVRPRLTMPDGRPYFIGDR